VAGGISCVVNTKENDENMRMNASAMDDASFSLLTGPARRNLDYTPIDKQIVTFSPGQDEAVITM